MKSGLKSEHSKTIFPFTRFLSLKFLLSILAIDPTLVMKEKSNGTYAS